MVDYIKRGLVSLAIVGSAVLAEGCAPGRVMRSVTYDSSTSIRERGFAETPWGYKERKFDEAQKVRDRREE
tara:strand:- start:258 stop:470 length:213 start_codon:yes stop_codon:yes gene_type:complete